MRNVSDHRDRTITVQNLDCRQVVDSRNVDHDRDVVVGARRERRLQGAETDHVQVSQKDDFKDEAEASMEVMIILRDDRVKNPEMINIMYVGSAVESSESALWRVVDDQDFEQPKFMSVRVLPVYISVLLARPSFRWIGWRMKQSLYDFQAEECSCYV